MYSESPFQCLKPMQLFPSIDFPGLDACKRLSIFFHYGFLCTDSVPLFVSGKGMKDRGELFPSAFSGSPLEENQDQCKCENLIMFQNLANEEVRKLTQRYILFQ